MANTPNRNITYGPESVTWYSWDSPIGLGIGVCLLLTGIGLLLWMLHLANIIH